MTPRWFVLNSVDEIFDGPFRTRGAAVECAGQFRKQFRCEPIVRQISIDTIGLNGIMLTGVDEHGEIMVRL